MNDNDLQDLIKIEDKFNIETTTFTLSEINEINKFTDLDDDIYSYFFVKKGKLSGNLNNQIFKLKNLIDNVDFDVEEENEKTENEETERKKENYKLICDELEYEDDDLYGWILKRFMDRSFIKEL